MRYLLLLLLVSFCSSCTNEIPVSLSSEPGKLILNAMLHSGEDENKITLAFTGYGNVTYVTDAKVYISINGDLKEVIDAPTYDRSNPNSSPGDYITRLLYLPGDTVKIEAVTADNKHRAWSEVVVPAPVYIERVDTASSVINTPFESLRFIHLKIAFEDDASRKNYYRISVDRVQTISAVSRESGRDTTVIIKTSETLLCNEDIVLTDGRPTPISSDNIFDSPENKYGVFDDSRIDGKYTMSVSTQYFPYTQEIYYGVHEKLKDITNIDMKLTVNLHSISEGEYFYLKALNLIDSDLYDTPLSEPIKLPGNISGGIGVMGISSRHSQTLSLSSYLQVRM
ncbi:DUF4249 domain-containing protein [Bacteroides sp. UBA939]|uniref:DUF4249 domain-containing protein n=1 Tax=Bacteroides sp. UBA939 TaxID=1946092 RepID=UPI0025C578D5|nr:DUF4249 domain-containing protein [Bacteroides sp. UBA939]